MEANDLGQDEGDTLLARSSGNNSNSSSGSAGGRNEGHDDRNNNDRDAPFSRRRRRKGAGASYTTVRAAASSLSKSSSSSSSTKGQQRQLYLQHHNRGSSSGERNTSTSAGGTPTSEEYTDLTRRGNISIPIFYLMIGFALTLSRLPLREFMRLELRALPSTQALVTGVIMVIPWTMKMVYAFISDNFPICGMRRKPYMVIGVIVCGSMWVLFAALEESPSLATTCTVIFFATFGLVLSDVMADTLVVERMQHEVGNAVGQLQTTCWIMRFVGSVTGYLLAGFMLRYTPLTHRQIFFFQGFLHICVLLPALYPLVDRRVVSFAELSHAVEDVQAEQRAERAEHGRAATREKTKRPLSPSSSSTDGDMSAAGESAAEPHELPSANAWNSMRLHALLVWDAIQHRYLWMPMLFIYVYGIIPTSGDAFANFLLGPLGFTDDEYTAILTIGAIGAAIGALIYKEYLRKANMHWIFVTVLVVSTLLSLSQLILIFRLNIEWGISDFWFAFGDEVITDVAGFIMQMPILVMCAKLVPKGVESTVYALLTVVWNTAGQISSNFSSLLTDAYGVTLTNFDNLWRLNLVTSLLTLVPIVFIPLTPARPDETKSERRSFWGGLAILVAVFGGLLFSIINAILQLSQHNPGRLDDSAAKSSG